MKKAALLAALAAAMGTTAAQAEYLYGFGNVSANYLDWSAGTEHDRAPYQDDFVYLELEGGAGFSWGELYGFFDLENVAKDSNEWRTSYKGTAAYKLGLGGLRAYAQHYATDGQFFSANNTVAGLQYRVDGDGWFFTPFVGAHYTITNPSWNDGFAGFNGGMFGWVAMYNFNVFDQSFAVTNWHESEFSRKAEYTAVSGETDDLSANGAVALWWNVTNNVSTGVQYRYAYNKLGTVGNQNAAIYTVKYNF